MTGQDDKMAGSMADDGKDMTNERLEIANRWISRLTAERSAAEDRAAQAETRLTAAEKALRFLSAKLADIEGHHSFKAFGRAELLRENEALAERVENLRVRSETAERHLASAQSETEMLRQKQAELAEVRPSNGYAEMEAGTAEAQSLATTDINEAEAIRNADQAEWLRQVNATMIGYPRWWAFMPRQWRMSREQQRLLRKGLFDAEAYLALYPDVSSSGMDPLRHYILHGMRENRSL